MSKPKRKALPENSDPAHLEIDGRFLKPGELENMKGASAAERAAFLDALTVRAMSQPEVTSAAIIQQFHGPGMNVNALVNELREQVAEVHKGSLKGAEAMLVSQAHALDALFCTLARRSHANSGAGHTDVADKYLRLALKAQSQCRTTLETLAEIKNPRPVAFVKQANIANGPQQVNNGMTPAHAGEIINQSNELSGGNNELLTNARASQIAGSVNSEMDAVGKIHRATN